MAWDGPCKNVPAQGVWRLQRVPCRTLRARNRPHPEHLSWQTLSICQCHVATAAKLESLWASWGSNRFRRGSVVSSAPDGLRQGTVSRPVSRANLPPARAGRGCRQSRLHPAAAPWRAGARASRGAGSMRRCATYTYATRVVLLTTQRDGCAAPGREARVRVPALDFQFALLPRGSGANLVQHRCPALVLALPDALLLWPAQ